MTKRSLDHVAAFVAELVEWRQVLARRIGLDHWRAAAAGQECAKVITIVGAVRQQVFCNRQRLQQCWGRPDVAPLTGREIERDQSPGCIGNCMDLGRAAASAAADRLRLGPPFPPALHRCALLLVLSMDCTSALSNCTSWLNMVCQMPAFDQRLNRL